MKKPWRDRKWPARSILAQGQKLAGVVMVIDGHDGGMFGFGDPDIESITVQMESGQCSYVPWALVKHSGDASDELLNLAHAVEVFLEGEV